MSPRPDDQDGFATLTHARLRAGQGDLRGARAILDELLVSEPHRSAARRLLEELASTPRPGHDAGSTPIDPQRRLAVLHDLLRRVTHNTGARG